MDYKDKLFRQTGLRYNLSIILHDIERRLKPLEHNLNGVRLVLPDFVVDNGETIYLWAQVKNIKTSENDRVTFYLKGENMTKTQIGTANVVSGVATTTYVVPSTLSAGDYTLEGVYAENDTQMTATDTADFKVRIGTNITTDNVYANSGTTATLTAHVKHHTNQNVNEGQVQFIVNGSEVGGLCTVSGGVATLQYSIPSSITSTATIAAQYKGTNTYGASVTATSSTLKIREEPTLIIDPVLSYNRADGYGLCQVIFSFEDSDGNPIREQMEITSVLLEGFDWVQSAGNPIEYDSGTGEHMIEIDLNQYEPELSSGSHTLTIITAQSNDYKSITGTATFIIRKQLTLTNSNVSVNRGGTCNLVCQVVDENQQNVQTGTVVFHIGSNNVNATVDANGRATATYTAANDAAYGSTVSYSTSYTQNQNYESANSSTNGVITVRKQTTVTLTDVLVNIGDTATLSADVVDEESSAVSTGSITFNIDDS